MNQNPPISYNDFFNPPYINLWWWKEIEVYNDVSDDFIEYVFYLDNGMNYDIRFIIQDITCPCCGKTLHKNGCNIIVK